MNVRCPVSLYIERMNDRTKNILVSIVQGLVSLPFLRAAR